MVSKTRPIDGEREREKEREKEIGKQSKKRENTAASEVISRKWPRARLIIEPVTAPTVEKKKKGNFIRGMNTNWRQRAYSPAAITAAAAALFEKLAA